MPQIKLNPSDPNSPKPYGTIAVDNRKTFRERLMDRFAAHEYVRVINIDDEPVMWQYMPEHSERHEFTADPMKITYRDDPELWVLDPGQDEVLVGANAYLMIDVLYKKIISKKTIAKNPNLPPGQARNFNWTDANAQEDLIDRIYLGKENPEFNFKRSETPITPLVPTDDDIAKDLGLNESSKPEVSASRARKVA